MRRYEDVRALVVDDEASTRLLLREALEDLGIAVTEAVDGADAIYKSLMTEFDLVTMDILMPNVDGMDAIRALRTVDPQFRIIIVSSCQDEHYRQAARELGVPHFLNKPIKLAELNRAVQDELARPRSTEASSLGHTWMPGPA